MRIEPRDIARLTALAGLIALIVAGLWLPHHRRVLQKRDQINRQENRLAQLRRAAVPTEASPAAIGVDEGTAALPDRSDLGSFLEQLSEDLAAESAQVQQLEANAIEEGNDFNRIPVTLHFTGSHAALYGLLSRIESSERTIRIDHLDVTSDPAEAEKPLEVKIELSTFSLPTKKAAS